MDPRQRVHRPQTSSASLRRTSHSHTQVCTYAYCTTAVHIALAPLGPPPFPTPQVTALHPTLDPSLYGSPKPYAPALGPCDAIHPTSCRSYEHNQPTQSIAIYVDPGSEEAMPGQDRP